MTKSLQPLKVFVVPAWVWRAAKRNKLSPIDILDYKKARSILSVNDMAEWFYINSHLLIDGNALSVDQLFSYGSPNLDSEDSREICNSVLPLSGTPEVANNVQVRLKEKRVELGCEYEFVAANSCLYLVLHEGFLTSVQSNDFMMEFVRDYLRNCYKLSSVHEVSEFPIFQTYLKDISKI